MCRCLLTVPYNICSRYLLQPVAIEVFSNDGRNQFLVFSSAEDRDAIYKELTHCIKSSSEATEAIAGAQSGSFDLPDSGGRLVGIFKSS